MRCRYCEAQITFVTTAKGRAMPVESREPEVYYLHLDDPSPPRAVIVLSDGQVIRGRVGAQHESGVTRVEGVESHFATCPGASVARKDRRGR